MNTRQQLYKKYRLEGYSKYAAAIKAGYSKTTAGHKGKQLDKVVNMQHWLELQGLTDKALAEHAFQGLNATKVVSANIIYGDADEKTNDFIEVPDWSTRHRYFETILKVGNYLNKIESFNEYKDIKILVVNNVKNNKDTSQQQSSEGNQSLARAGEIFGQ
jgi:hypothetical protein